MSIQVVTHEGPEDYVNATDWAIGEHSLTVNDGEDGRSIAAYAHGSWVKVLAVDDVDDDD